MKQTELSTWINTNKIKLNRNQSESIRRLKPANKKLNSYAGFLSLATLIK